MQTTSSQLLKHAKPRWRLYGRQQFFGYDDIDKLAEKSLISGAIHIHSLWHPSHYIGGLHILSRGTCPTDRSASDYLLLQVPLQHDARPAG